MTKKLNRPSPTDSPLLFELDTEQCEETITARAGIPLLVQTFRALGLSDSVRRHIHIKERQRGYDETTFVESFVILNAAGGECLDDFDELRKDDGLCELIGHEIPSATAARTFLYQFHSDEEIMKAQAQLPLGQVAYVPGESEPLRGLAGVNRDLIQSLGKRCPDQKIATVDLDTTLIESRKQEAQPTYEGFRGYQPMMAVWAEMNVVVADEFRDGNVTAMMDPLRVAKSAFAALPETVTTYCFRGDSACYEGKLIDWLRDENRNGGPQGFMAFAISARLTKRLAQAIQSIQEKDWISFGDTAASEICACAEVAYVPWERNEKKDTQPLRYVAIRIRKRQGELFSDGSQVKHFAIVTNLWDWPASRVIEWHRQKAGTIEIVNDVIKNELAGGVLPCGRFGANAAWFRLAILSHNVMTALKRLALKPEMLNARPKRMRFLYFCIPGKVVHHARKLLLRLRTDVDRIRECLEILRLLQPETC
jgi:hypothetical protein